MAAVANVAIEVQVGNALAALRSLDGATKNLGSKISGLGQAMSGLAGVAAGIGAGAAVGGFVKAGIEADRTAKTIKALAGQYKEAAGVTKIANDAAKQYGLGQTTAAKAVADLYGRLRPMGVSLENIGKTFNGVNKAAALMNLTAADTDGVLLQLSQAMGSGALQGDELRSIMERLPAVGQAVAKVMGVSVGEIKKLGAEGKITTDVLIKAMDELNKIQPPPPDAYKQFQAALQDLNTAIGTQLLPIFTPLVQKLSEVIAKFKELGVGATVVEALRPIGDFMIQLLNAFVQLPEPVQKFIIAVGAVGGAFALVAAPLGIFLQGLGTVVSVIGTVAGAVKGLSIFATLAGWLGALQPAITAVVALLTGPVGIVVGLVAVGVAIYAFRDQIGQALQAVGKYFSDAAQGFKFAFIDPIVAGFKALVQFVTVNFVQPVGQAISGLVQKISEVFKAVTNAITAPFKAAFESVRGIVNQILNGIGRAVGSVVQAINNVIAGANRALARLGLPQIPMLPMPNIPQFADGGVVTGPTLAMVGEGGEPEYIVPQSKAAGFAQNWISGKRGIGAVPGFAEGGMVAPASANVSIQTGPVTQMNGTNFVTTQDMTAAVRAGVQQTLDLIRRDGSVRAQLGLA